MDDLNLFEDLSDNYGCELDGFLNDIKNFQYVGWVPCISGRLNYDNASVTTSLDSEISAVAFNKKLKNSSFSDGERVLAITSTHDWQDTFDGRVTGKFKIVVVGRADSFNDYSLLKIKLGIIPSNHADKTFKDVDGLVDQLKTMTLSSDEDVKNFNQLLTSLEDLLSFDSKGVQEVELGRSAESYSREAPIHHLVDAILHPNGLIACKYIDDDFRDKDLSDDAYLETREAIVRQAYYYLKYLFHQHKHHLHSDDSVCTIIPLPAAQNQVGPILVGDLITSLTQCRRHFKIISVSSFYYMDSHYMGFLGYIGSLAKSCLRVGFYDQVTYDNQIDRLNYLEKSYSAIVSERQEEKLNKGRSLQSLSITFQFYTAVLLVFGTYSLLQKVDYSDSKKFPEHWGMDYLTVVFSFSIVFFVTYYVFKYIENHRSPDFFGDCYLKIIKRLYSTPKFILITSMLILILMIIIAVYFNIMWII